MTEAFLFALTVTGLLATPGPTNTLLLTAAIANGIKPLRLIPAEIAGYVVAVLAIAYCVGPLVAQAGALGIALRSGAALYLMMVALRLWRRGGVKAEIDCPITARDVFTTTLLNPKAILFGLGIVPLRDPDWIAYLASFCLLIAIVGGGWVVLGLAIRRGLLPKAGIPLVPRIGATVIAGFAGFLALAPLL